MVEKILIVDDDVQTLRLIGLMLERQGFRILTASTGAQALHTARVDHPDVIVLDVMMPDLDGFEVCRRLRKDPETTNVPILMFTARVQTDDKVSGYEAGADDYLTKPIHPAELTAHLRALLSRKKARNSPSQGRGYMIGVLSAKGGTGVSTLALNLALAFHQKTNIDVIAAEMHPGQGTWGYELGSTSSEGLNNLLRMHAADISATTIENELTRLPYGIRILQASPRLKDTEMIKAIEPMGAVVHNLPLLAKLVVLDLGTPSLLAFDELLEQCNEVILVTEPYPTSIQRTHQLIKDIEARGFRQSKPITVVCINRTRTDIQLSLVQMNEMLGAMISLVIPPAPELAFQAATRNIPLIQTQIGNPVCQQYISLAEQLVERVLE